MVLTLLHIVKEFEIITEPKPPIKITPEKSEEERLKEYHKFFLQHSGKFDSTKMDKMCLNVRACVCVHMCMCVYNNIIVMKQDMKQE